MQKLFSALNAVPEMTAGLYTRFTITLYTLIKKYYPKLDVICVTTKDNIAVLSLNGVILNPYIGLKIDPCHFNNNGLPLDFFLEKKVPESPEAIAYIEALHEVLVLASRDIPLTVENVARYQSKVYERSLAVDVYHDDSLEDVPSKVYPRKGELIELWSNRRKRIQKLRMFVPESLKPATLRKTGFRFPDIDGIVTDVKLGWVNPDLEIDLVDSLRDIPGGEFASIESITLNDSHSFKGDGTEDLTIHHVPGAMLPSGEFKPMANLEALEIYQKGGDFVAGGLFSIPKSPQNLLFQAYAKGPKSLVLDPKVPLFTLILTVNDLTVHGMTDADESSIGMPL
jgi:hypothetical protein